MEKKKVDVVLPIKVNICYTVEVNEVNPASIREALLKKDPSEGSVDPNFYKFFGSAFRDVVNRMSDSEIEKCETCIKTHCPLCCESGFLRVLRYALRFMRRIPRSSYLR